MPELSRSELIETNKNAAPAAYDWVKDTVIHPLLNAALIEPCNTVSNAISDASGRSNRCEIKALATKKAQPYTTDWFVESAASGAGSMLPFLISGKLAGCALKGTASRFELRGTSAAILNSEKTAMLSGAGAYAALKRPNEGETRLGNAVGTVAAFAVFESGNSLAKLPQFKQSFATRSVLRLGTGFAGGVTQVELASLISQHKHARTDMLMQSGISGASLNFSMGLVQDRLPSASQTKNAEARNPQQEVKNTTAGNSAEKIPARLEQKQNNTATTQTEPKQDMGATARDTGTPARTAHPEPITSMEVRRAEAEAADAVNPDIPTKGLLAQRSAPVNLVRADNPTAKANVAEPADRKGDVVYIVVDSGFSPESLPAKHNILGTWDPTGEGVFNDPLNHGSIVLSKLREADPQAKFMLIKAYDGANNLAQTRFENGQIAKPGWTEAYLEAVALAKQHKLPSVGNCSFGEFTHAMDGTGWESFQLSHAVGAGKQGHVLVAATGPGTGVARHASGVVEAGKSGEVSISQNGEAAFNLWMGKNAPRDWSLSVYEGRRLIHAVDGKQLEPNFWNNRQQVTFRSWIDNPDTRFVLQRTGADPRPLSFDFFVQEGNATFKNHINPELISEPAVFPHVVSVGIKDMSYSPSQTTLGAKPDVLLPGNGPVSFRTPEITHAIGQMLKANPELDATQVQKLLGKYPQGK